MARKKIPFESITPLANKGSLRARQVLFWARYPTPAWVLEIEAIEPSHYGGYGKAYRPFMRTVIDADGVSREEAQAQATAMLELLEIRHGLH